MQSSKVNQEWKKEKKPGDEKGDASLKPHRCTCGINNKELRMKRVLAVSTPLVVLVLKVSYHVEETVSAMVATTPTERK